ncbi:synaptotagmin-like protein 1 isoform X2 [Hypanus sabinus]|uniref:synaptotagmin-like protein 1 isoform X2 n=1 Tax=Hypanus sabinus TaxID=79690 RepID=UPI0028C378C2|nr:synaptotagmin-like protein 1 isoform X2 [Hypanus sabinus]
MHNRMKGVMADNLDLSFLTEDEYQAVLKVVQRDSELKQKDSERIRTIQQSIQDEKQKKLVTGQWFDEVKAKRYRDALLGVDLIKASMRRENPIKHETAEKIEQQQVHQTPPRAQPKLPQAAKCENTSFATGEAPKEQPGDVENVLTKQQIKPRSTVRQDTQRTPQNDSWESSSDDSDTVRVSPETLEKGLYRSAVFRTESAAGGQVPDPTKHDNVAYSPEDTTEAHLSTEIREPTSASVEYSPQVPRVQEHLVLTEDPQRTPEEPEHSNLNDHTVTTVASPVRENIRDVQKPKKTVAVHYKGAPIYQTSATSDKKKTVTSNISHIPKRKNQVKESGEVTSEKPEDVTSEQGSRVLPPTIATEDQQAHQPLEGLDLSATPQIPRLKRTLETTGPTYGLSPVMRALARARKANAKSMDNLISTLDRETITSLVNDNETKGDGNDQLPTEEKISVIKTPVLEHARVKELSKSVPMLMTESESDSASEISFNIGWHRKTPSDASHSSDMASVSSVSGSIMSVYSADFGSIDAQGSVQFALDYNEKNKEFQIYVSQCKDLAVVDEKKGRTDAYVKTYLLPDKARMGKRKTSVKKRNTNPLYNEILKYKIEKSVLLIQRLNLSVWHNDTLGRNSFLGEVDLDLASWDWSNRELNWYLLKSRIPAVGVEVDHRGEINLAIKYIPVGTLGTGDPPTGEVHIWMKNARDLPQLRSSGVDSFVKCYVLPDTSKKSYQKTRIVKKDINPVYNHTIVYDGFRTEDLKEVCVELTVWDHEKLTNHFLGGLRLGLGTGYSYGIPVEWMDSTEEEVALWQEMMSSPNEWIPGSLILRSRLGGKKLK